ALSSATFAFAGGYTQSSGLLALLNGATVSADTLDLEGGALAGGGTVTGNIENRRGVVFPGFGNNLVVQGDYTQGPDADLADAIGGTVAGAKYGQLQVQGSAAFDGTLGIAWLDTSTLDPGRLQALVMHAYADMHIRAFTLRDMQNILAYAAATY